jgi:predicted aspartyl protease
MPILRRPLRRIQSVSLSLSLGALALLPALAHAAGDAGSCRYVPIARMAVDYSSTTHQATVTATINGKPARMLVDTGATTMLMRSGAERLGLRLESTGSYGYGIGGASVNYITHVNDFSVGASHTGKADVPVIGTPGVGPNDGVVGADYLLQTDMELSLADNTLQFFRASGCGDTNLAYWDNNAIEIPFVGRQGNSLKPLVEVELNGVKFKALLDTGATTSVVTRHAAELAGVRVDTPAARPSGKARGFGEKALDSWIADFKSFRMGEETVNNPQLQIMDDMPQGQDQFDMLLGMDFLRAHHILFAMSQGRLYMSYLGGELFGAHQQAAAAPKAP